MKGTVASFIIFLAVLFAPGPIFALEQPAPGAVEQGNIQAQNENRPWRQMWSNMTPMRDRMMARIYRMNRELNQKLAAMNAAKTENEQIAAMKAVINEMAAQHKECMDRFMGMRGRRWQRMGGAKGPRIMMHRKGGKSMVVIIQE